MGARILTIHLDGIRILTIRCASQGSLTSLILPLKSLKISILPTNYQNPFRMDRRNLTTLDGIENCLTPYWNLLNYQNLLQSGQGYQNPIRKALNCQNPCQSNQGYLIPYRKVLNCLTPLWISINYQNPFR